LTTRPACCPLPAAYCQLPSGGRLFEGIGDLEEVELPEVPIDRVQPADAVLPEEGRQVGVRDEVAAHGEAGGHLTVDLKKSLPLREQAHARQAEEGLDVAEGIVGRERLARIIHEVALHGGTAPSPWPSPTPTPGRGDQKTCPSPSMGEGGGEGGIRDS